MTTPKPQLALDFYASPSSPGDALFLGFTPDHDENDAARVFLRRYGRQPQYLFESRGLRLVGPIPEVTPWRE